MQDLHLQPMTFSQARHPTKTREINGTETPHTFGENQARIAEIEQGSHGSIAPAPKSDLPPKGAPGPKGRRLRAFVIKAQDALAKGDVAGAKKLLDDGIATYNRDEA